MRVPSPLVAMTPSTPNPVTYLLPSGEDAAQRGNTTINGAVRGRTATPTVLRLVLALRQLVPCWTWKFRRVVETSCLLGRASEFWRKETLSRSRQTRRRAGLVVKLLSAVKVPFYLLQMLCNATIPPPRCKVKASYIRGRFTCESSGQVSVSSQCP